MERLRIWGTCGISSVDVRWLSAILNSFYHVRDRLKELHGRIDILMYAAGS